MTDAILNALGTVLTRWTMGGSAGPVAPAAWRDALGTDSQEAELRLLALSGQFLGTQTLAGPVGDINGLADLPMLAKPPLAEALRPRARRLLTQLRDSAGRRTLLDFLDGRGWTLHPGDWLPGPNEDVPEIYAPWQDWAATVGKIAPGTAELTADDWDDLAPAARRAAFAALRRQDPERAARLLAEKIGGETPDTRVRLVELLGLGLSDADRPLLDSLAGDRAPRVKALAAALLARLGHGIENGEDAAELAGFFPVQTKGFLRRARVITPQPLKTTAQRNRRATLMENLSFGGFATAIDLAPEAVVTAWPWGSDHAADRLLADMVSRSAADATVAAIAEALTTGAAVDPYALAPLLPRLTPAQRRTAAARILGAKDSSFAMVLPIAGGDARIEDAIRTRAGVALLAELGTEEAKSNERSAELTALGLIASRGAARQAIEQVVAAGLIASDPRLDMLRLNAALDDKGAMG